MKHQIKHRFSGAVLYECEVPDDIASSLRTRHALEQATKERADLSGAYLSGAYLRGADLIGAYLSGADLGDANLSDADLIGAYLRGAYLSGAYLSGAYLSGAYLRGADLIGAYLSGADLGDANLSDADLSGAYLRGAYLSGAYLIGADLGGAEPASPEQSIANLDKVREIILDNKARLEMGHWHVDDAWKDRTCAEETLCNTTHCLAGWLQVCSTDPKVRELEPFIAGVVAAPIASKMFYRGSDEVLSWLDERKYVAEIAKREKRKADVTGLVAMLKRATNHVASVALLDSIDEQTKRAASQFVTEARSLIARIEGKR